MADEVSPYVLNDITQIVTAIGVILTAVSSLLNRMKLGTVEKKVDTAVVVAAETKAQNERVHTETVTKVEEVRQAVQDTKDAAVAVNAEVVKEVHDAGVAAGQAMNGRDKH